MGDIVLTSYQNEPAVMPYIPAMRGYLHCARGVTNATAGAVTFAFVNTDANRSFEIGLSGVNIDETRINMSVREEWVLSSAGMGPPGPHQSMLSSLHVLLNGKLLQLSEANEMPPLEGKRVVGGHFVAPPRTYGFVRYPHAGATACLPKAAGG